MEDNDLVWYYEGKIAFVKECSWNGIDQHWFVELHIPAGELTRIKEFISSTNKSMTYRAMKDQYPEYLV